MLKALSVAGIATLLLAQAAPQPSSDLPVDQIKLPPGFSINVFARGVTNARSLAHGSRGTLFVGSRTLGKKATRSPIKKVRRPPIGWSPSRRA